MRLLVERGPSLRRRRDGHHASREGRRGLLGARARAMKAIALANSKGGTGKTACAVHIATGLARRKKRVLLVDLDYQQNSTRWLLGREMLGDEPGAPEALESARIEDSMLQEVEGWPTLQLLPSTRRLPAAELAVASAPAGQAHLRRALSKAQSHWDFVVIDCAPNLGTGTVAGLCAADFVFVPIPPAYLSLMGVGGLEATVTRLRDGFGVATVVGGYILFAVDSREGLASATRQLLQREAKGKLMRAEVRLSTAGKRLPELRQTAWDAGADPRGAEDYGAVLDEVIKRCERAR